MNSRELRKAFLDFFMERGHTLVASAPLVPKKDPTILFNVAGMVQFKPLWAGMVDPLPYTRATSVQKCLRLNDVDVVGTDATHDTFFEMLGNFSFGDYQKKEAISFAWEFVTKFMKLSVERLWVTVHETDEEAAKIWREEIGLAKHRVVYLGDADNFWGPVGGRGACGPSSEIFWDLKWKNEDEGKGPAHNEDERYTEIWNLVFPQFNQQEDGSRPFLKYRGIDTGAGLERMTMAAQDVETIFHTDLFKPLMQAAADTIGMKTSKETWEPLAITADHVRAITNVISEGVRPSNTKQGYVVRRLLRRTLGALYLFGVEEPLLYRISGQVIEQMRHVYPELEERREQVALMIKGEEERFLKTLESGMHLFEDAAHAGKISGQDAFKLYDTFGFPIDLTKLLAKHKGIEVDLGGFEKAMEGQREKSRQFSVTTSDGVKVTFTASFPKEQFKGYDGDVVKTKILYIKEEEGKVTLALEESPFYAESGGQIADKGKIIGEGFEIEVIYVTYNNTGDRVTIGKFVKGKYSKDLEGSDVRAIVDIPRRREIERAHTATHLLHAALRKTLGEHVKQEGSLVEPGRLRFDFYHPSPMTQDELKEVQRTVYNWIIENHSSIIKEMSIDEAQAKGALAFFGEKYGDKVRVVEIPGVSTELCGGTHLDRTGDIGMFLIASESGVAAGIRRIEALVGNRAFAEIEHEREILSEISNSLGSDKEKLLKKLEELKQNLTHEIKSRETLARKYAESLITEILGLSEKFDETDFVCARVEGVSRDDLRLIADSLKSRRDNIVGLLVAPDDSRMAILCFSSRTSSQKYPAGEILKAVASRFKGGGGGSATLAEGSIAETSLDDLTSAFMQTLKKGREK
jgi:alanyl-tRNA synthetase